VSDFALETPRLHERPEHVLFALTRIVDTDVSPELLELRMREADGKRKKAEYAAEAAFTALGGLRVASVKKRTLLALEAVRFHGREAALGWLLAEQIIASLRVCTLAVGERLFEHGLVDQPRDVLQLEVSELAGIVRGTGVDSDVKPLVAARKRAAVARPAGLPRRVETRGVVATSLLSGEDEDEAQITTPPTEEHEIQGRGASSGDVHDTAVLLDPSLLGAERPSQARGVVVVRSPTLRDLPLLAAARAVVAERGTVYGPAAFALRALGVPLVVDAAHATSTLADGVHLHVDANIGVVRRAGVEHVDGPASAVVDPHVFAREAVVSDPRMRVRPSRPAQAFDEIPPPPLVRPATTMDEFVSPPSARDRSATGQPERSERSTSQRSASNKSATGRPVEGPFDDAYARERPPQILGPAADPDAVGRFGGRGRAELAGFRTGTPSEEKSVDDGDIVQSTDLESTEIYDHDPRNAPKRK
jgi:phosphohistidine swiveling domain-containing protein